MGLRLHLDAYHNTPRAQRARSGCRIRFRPSSGSADDISEINIVRVMSGSTDIVTAVYAALQSVDPQKIRNAAARYFDDAIVVREAESLPN
jgi:hypothetical protein